MDQSPLPTEPPKKSFFPFILTLFLIIALIPPIYLAFAYFSHTPLLSPLASQPAIRGFSAFLTDKPDRIVYGFLPYWNFKYADDIPYQYLTHLSVFGLSFNPDGTIQRREQDYTEPGYYALTSANFAQIVRRAKSSGTKVTLTITAFDNDTIDSIIESPSHTQTLIDQTIDFISLHNLDGVNLDFEYLGNPSNTSRQSFTRFAAKLAQALKDQGSNLHFSISVFADSAQGDRIWQLTDLGQIADHLVIMAYDFHRPSSTIAGPVAPLYGSGDLFKHDITSLLSEHLKLNPPDKLLLGVPFYGYQWRTVSSQHLSSTYPGTGSLASHKRVLGILTDKTASASWDPVSLSPWLVFQDEDDTIQQIYYEDTRSLALKYDLVNQTDLAGIAIWALGYDGNDQDLWSLIPQKFN